MFFDPRAGVLIDFSHFADDLAARCRAGSESRDWRFWATGGEKQGGLKDVASQVQRGRTSQKSGRRGRIILAGRPGR